MTHRWAQVRLHKKLVVGSVFAGVLFGLLLSNALPTTYMSKVVIDTGVIGCGHGFAITDTCSWCEDAKRPLSLRWAGAIDRAAMSLGFDNPNLESNLEKAGTKVKRK